MHQVILQLRHQGIKCKHRIGILNTPPFNVLIVSSQVPWRSGDAGKNHPWYIKLFKMQTRRLHF